MMSYIRDFSRFFEFSQRPGTTATTAMHARRPLATVARPAARSPRTARGLAGVGGGAAPPAPSEPPPPPHLGLPLGPPAHCCPGRRGGELGPRRPSRPRGVPGVPAWCPPAPERSGGRACASRVHAGVSGGEEGVATETVGGGGRAMEWAVRARAPRTRRRRRGWARAGSARTGHAGGGGTACVGGGGAPGSEKVGPPRALDGGLGGVVVEVVEGRRSPPRMPRRIARPPEGAAPHAPTSRSDPPGGGWPTARAGSVRGGQGGHPKRQKGGGEGGGSEGCWAC